MRPLRTRWKLISVVPARRDSRHWRAYLTLGGLILGLLAFTISPLSERAQAQNKDAAQGASNQPNPPAAASASANQVSSVVQQNSCDRSQADKQSDHCFEWESVEASEQQARWARYSFYAGLAGIVLVVLTFIATAIAAWASHRSANAARDSADVARLALTNLERPFVYVEIRKEEAGVEFGYKGFITWGATQLRFVNCGRSPAIFTRMHVEPTAKEVGIPPDFCNPSVIGGRSLPSGIVATEARPLIESLSLHGHYSESAQEAVGIDEDVLWISGFVRYKDFFEVHHITGFAIAFDPERQTWVSSDDDERNYTRQEQPNEIPGPS